MAATQAALATATARAFTSISIETRHVADKPELGEILVDSKGMTLYIFDADNVGKMFALNQCAVNWPPLIVEAENDVKISKNVTGKVGTINNAVINIR